MSETDVARQSDGPLPPPPKRRRWLIVLLMAAVFLCGAVCGAGLTAVLIARGVRQAVHHPEQRVDRGARWLGRRLNLTPEQEKQVREILLKQNEDFTALRGEVWPRVETRLEKTQAEIAAVLTPEQQGTWRRVADELRKKWLPPPGGPPRSRGRN